MKLTLDAAMRARDVSRPHAEHEDQAFAREPQYARARDQDQGTRDTQPTGSAAAETAAGVVAEPASGGAPKGRSSRRRRRRR